MENQSKPVVTIGDYGAAVRTLAARIETICQYSLEEYLRALWGLAQNAKETTVTFGLIVKLLTDACTAAPLPFDEAWLQFTSPPDDLPEGGFSAYQHLILYQIADLHRMAADGSLDNPYRYFGITSPTGHSWYNFDVASFLTCAIRSLDPVDPDSTECGWEDLTLLLWLGQIYE